MTKFQNTSIEFRDTDAIAWYRETNISPELVDCVVKRVRDDSGRLVNPDDYERNIVAAIRRYSLLRPDRSVVDITGNGTKTYSLPAGWAEGFSGVKSIEYPVDEIPATYLEAEDYEIYQAPSGKVIRLLKDSPEATESFRVTFTIPRISTTILENDYDAVCNLAAGFCLEDLANSYAQSSDSTISADSVDYRSKSQEFASRAKRMVQLWKDHMGIKDEDITPPASAVTDMSIGYPGGGDRLTHPKRQRKKR